MECKSKKSTIARNKKRYWRKGTKLDDVEEFLQNERIEQSEGGPLRDRPESELFAIDRAPAVPSNKLTRKQAAALNKRQLLQKIQVDKEDVKPSRNVLKYSFPKKNKKPSRPQMHLQSPTHRPSSTPYDLWADGESKQPASAELELIENHYMKSTKRCKPREPPTLKHVPSLLPSIEVVEPGASYNPALSNYQKYVDDIAKEEVEVEKKEEKLQKALALAPGQSYISELDIMAEESAGLFDETESMENEFDDHETDAPAVKDTDKLVMGKRKTSKMRQIEALERKKKLMQQADKDAKSAEQMIFAVKKINSEISKQLSDIDRKAKLRRKRKLSKRLLGAQHIGRGKFTPQGRPFLLTDELSGSLRELKPQGDIIVERLKSIQKRNMLPIPGEGRVHSKLKKKLRVKLSQKRSYKDVTLGSRVI